MSLPLIAATSFDVAECEMLSDQISYMQLTDSDPFRILQRTAGSVDTFL
jgi:hypothetical protein